MLRGQDILALLKNVLQVLLLLAALGRGDTVTLEVLAALGAVVHSGGRAAGGAFLLAFAGFLWRRCRVRGRDAGCSRLLQCFGGWVGAGSDMGRGAHGP